MNSDLFKSMAMKYLLMPPPKYGQTVKLRRLLDVAIIFVRYWITPKLSVRRYSEYGERGVEEFYGESIGGWRP